MSRRPKETRLIYRTNAIYTFNVFSVLRKFRHAALYINGGGSLMQDVTSTRSIWYYCYTLYAAKKRGCKVMMYGCGIGPINRPGNRRMARPEPLTHRLTASRCAMTIPAHCLPKWALPAGYPCFRRPDHHSDAGAA